MYFATFCFIILDMVTGLIKAFKNHEFESSVMREGLFHKSGSLLLIVFGVLVDYAQQFVDLGVEIPLTLFICSYIILMEIGSIIENIGKINPEIVPKKLRALFSKLGDRS